jgi:preprotein translocase subunit SecB
VADSVIAPLGVGDYQILRLHFDVDPSGEVDRSEISMGLSHQFGTHKERPNTYMLSLTLGVNLDEETFKAHGYRIETTAAASFHVADGAVPEQDVVGYVLVNGLSLLYSGLRSEVATITGQSAVGRVTIPAVNMVEYLKSKQVEDAPPE